MISVQNLKHLETDLMDAIGLGNGVIQVGRIDPYEPNRKPKGIFVQFDDGHEIEIRVKLNERKTH